MMNKKGIGARPLWMIFITVGLFAICGFMFMAGWFAQNSSIGVMSGGDALVNTTRDAYIDINESMGGLQTSSESWYSAFRDDTPDVAIPFLIVRTIFTLPFDIMSSILGVAIGLFKIIYIVLGPAGAIIFGIAMASLFVTFIFVIIKVVRTGETER